MYPKEFDWKEDQQVTVTNPTSEDFAFMVHSKSYVVAAGSTAKMPGYMAWVYVNKIAVQMAQKAGDFSHWNEEGFRKTYYDKIVVGVDDVMQTVVPEPQIEPLSTPETTVKPLGGRNGKSA